LIFQNPFIVETFLTQRKKLFNARKGKKSLNGAAVTHALDPRSKSKFQF